MTIFTHKRSKVIFSIYLLFIINFVIIKFTGNIEHVVARIQANIFQKSIGYWKINLNPVVTLKSSFHSFQNSGITSYEVLYFIGNVLIFLPMGFLIPFLLKKQSLFKTMFCCLLLIVGIELTQFITYLGSADMADVFLNMIGCLFGYIGNKIYCSVEDVFINRSHGN
ncbi:VanZ family protein [Paenibacillus massiliensis]|uniref:VanZ family protein n=1 Tax=Paenibacillus massiliensis TaxID=225917 RepID=UPI00035E13B1|nr:VanZ family protein [Paenibacillus massiliensis]